MSYNTRLFDLYNWSKNKETRNKIFELIKDEAPDIICFQEFFYSTDSSYFNTLDTLLVFQDAKNYHAEYATVANKNHFFGIATFSKYPIINRGKVKISERTTNACIYTDIKINSDTVRVYNMHLASIHFGNEDYKFLETINKTDTEKQIKQSKRIIERLNTAFKKRAAQADIIAEHIKNSTFPVLVCGDFNDTPTSYTYHTISVNLIDPFIGSGMGTGTTYAGKFPSFRIDYILHDTSIVSSNYTIIKKNYSDHYPVTCHIKLYPKNASRYSL